MIRIILLISFKLYCLHLFPQYTLIGKIVDSETGEPLPFVSIIYNEMGQGITTGIDGDFSLTTPIPVTEINTNYLGYIPQTFKITQNNYKQLMLIGLIPTSYRIDEVSVSPGVNPAHRIIDEVYRNREKNNPEQLPEFRYHSYNKMYFTALRDSTSKTSTNKADNVMEPSVDSIELKVDRLLRRQHLFMMESITERTYMNPNRNYEKILAHRVSGLKDPLLAFLATQYQSFSFYSEILSLGGRQYLNPISRRSNRQYLFILEDTLLTQTADTIFVISFRPLRNKNFAAVKGVMSINTNGYAIQNVIAEPVEPPSTMFNIKIQQRYEYVDSTQWFPVELNTNLFLNTTNVQERDSATIQSFQYQIVGVGSSYIQEINLKPNLKQRDFNHVLVSFDPLASMRDEEFWLPFRKKSLTKQELRTYQFVDSVSRKINMDRMLAIIDAVVTGKVPLGFINLDINHLMGYNRFEGYRIGVGLETNQRVSRWISLGGYYAYGFKDEEDKFGGFARLTLSDHHQINLEGRYEFDVREPGEVVFERQHGLINSDLFRSFMIDRMDYVEKYSALIGFRPSRRITVKLVGSRNDFTIASKYYYNHINLSSPQTFRTYEAGIELKFVWHEAFIETSKGLMPFKFEHPVIWVNYFKGFEHNGLGFDYSRLELRLNHQITHRVIGRTNITLSCGQIAGDIPTPILYFTPGSMDRYPLDATNSFGTMSPFEFVSDKYVYAFLRHNFGNIFWKTNSKLFKPHIEIVQNFALGNYTPNPMHIFHLSNPKSLSKGFFETGMLVNRVLSNPFYAIGIGTYFRWGYYSNQSWQENIALKVTLTSSF